MRLVLLAVSVAAAAMALFASSAPARDRPVTSLAVTFQVQNLNRTKLACGTDGASYAVKGHLVGPRSALGSKRSRRRAATVYLHGLGFGEWFWRFGAVKGYDYAAAQARKGHTSVVVDRLGYDASSHPDGNQSCLGGQADIAHQIVQALRSGSYGVEGGRPVRFKRIALAGHSIGAEIANIEAYSFRDVEALIVMSFSFSNLPRAQVALGPTRDSCLAGGQPAEPGLASGYAYYGQATPADFQSIMINDATPSVIAAASSLRNRDPCGDIASIIPALLQQRANVNKIRVPVLVICGTRDALYSSLGCAQQRARYTRSRSTSLERVRNAGHSLAIERPARSFRSKLSRWLGRRGF